TARAFFLVGRACGGRAVVDVRRPAAAPIAWAGPALPEEQREQNAHEPHAHEDPADRVDVHAARGCVDREGQDRADGDQEDANSESHEASLSYPSVFRAGRFPNGPGRGSGSDAGTAVS